MAKVKVYRFVVYEIATDEMKVSSRMATRDAIERLKVVEYVVAGSGFEIDPALLDGNGMSDRIFAPFG